MTTLIENIELVSHKHFVAVLFSVFVGLVVVCPQVLFIYNLGADYQGIQMAGADAELHYLARMQESVDGGGLGNPFIYEYKNNVPSTTYTISETVLAWPATVFGFSVPSLSLFYKFLLPVIIALLVYSLTYRLAGSRSWSVASMFAIVLGSTLVNFPDIVHLLRWEKVYTQFTLYSRPVNPEFSSILFFTYLHVFLTALRRKTWNWYILLGLLFGLSFYVYLYSYTFFFVLNLVLLSIYIVKKEKKVSLYIFSAGVLGMVVGSLSIINSFKLYVHPYFQDMASLSDIVSSHHPIISIAGVVVVIIFLVFALKHKDYPNLTFLGALLATSFIVINQQIITGILIQEGHYHWYFNTPIFILISVIAGCYFVGRKYRVVGVLLAVIVSVIAFSSAVLIQTSSYEYWSPKTADAQKYAAVLSWLKKETPKESVVLANQSLSELIPVYTSDNVVWEKHAAFYLLPKERREFTTDNIMAATDLGKALSQYRVDYLVWDSIKEPNLELDSKSFLKKLYDNGEFKIYDR